MATRIRLQRFGRKHRPFYRIVVADKDAKRDGKFITVIGYYDPTTNPHTIKIDKKKLEHWKKLGAKPTEAVLKLIK